MGFRTVDPRDLPGSLFHGLSENWMLISAGGPEGYNTMTASWGMAGVLWSRPTAEVFVRPQRYTYGFMEQSEYFTCSFFGRGMRPALTYCGTHSGREGDKAAATGLTPVFDRGSVYFAQAETVLVLRKLYAQDLSGACFIDGEADAEHYPQKDYHRAYVGEIVACLVRE